MRQLGCSNPGRRDTHARPLACCEYTSPLKWWDARQYVQTYRSGNVSLSELLRGLVYLVYFYGTLAKSERYGGPSRWFYDRFQRLWGGFQFPRRRGVIAAGGPTPRSDLNLQPGELVRMKSYEDILATLDKNLSNRGLKFDAEFVPYCGRVFRVQRQVERFVDESTGLLRTLKTPAVILDGVFCKSQFAGQRIFCPRAIYLWCREIWLERVSEGASVRPHDDAKRAEDVVTECAGSLPWPRARLKFAVSRAQPRSALRTIPS